MHVQEWIHGSHGSVTNGSQCKIVLDKEQCFCPLRCKSIVSIIIYLSSTREKPIGRDRRRWSTEITLSQFCQSRKLLLVLCPPCVAVTCMEFQKWLREILININLWPEIYRTCTCLFQDFWKAFPQVFAWSPWRWFLSSQASSCFTQFFLFVLQHLSGGSSFTRTTEKIYPWNEDQVVWWSQGIHSSQCLRTSFLRMLAFQTSLSAQGSMGCFSCEKQQK